MFPPAGSVTVCEIQGQLIAAEHLSDDIANQCYGSCLGVVFTPVPHQLSSHPHRRVENPLSVFLQAVSNGPGPDCVTLLSEVDLKCVGWNAKMDLLAFVSARNQVTVCDYGYSGEGTNTCILINDLQKEAKVIEWVPNAGKTLSVGCKGGICIWAALHPGNTTRVRPGVNYGLPITGSGVTWTLVDFFRGQGDEQISALSWSPDGRYVASASCKGSFFTIWDFAQGLGTPMRRGFGNISILKWSSTGAYLFAANFDNTFSLWETNTWTYRKWSSTNGFVTGAAWDPSGRMILLAFSELLTVTSVHFDTKPPSLVANLTSVELPELRSLTKSRKIEKMAWDARGERLAVSYGDSCELYKGLIALYSVGREATPVTPSLIGFIRGPGADSKPLSFSFHNKYKQGPLLSVCWSTGSCITYPLLIRTNQFAPWAAWRRFE